MMRADTDSHRVSGKLKCRMQPAPPLEREAAALSLLRPTDAHIRFQGCPLKPSGQTGRAGRTRRGHRMHTSWKQRARAGALRSLHPHHPVREPGGRQPPLRTPGSSLCTEKGMAGPVRRLPPHCFLLKVNIDFIYLFDRDRDSQREREHK